jgi:hypothetical protein
MLESLDWLAPNQYPAQQIQQMQQGASPCHTCCKLPPVAIRFPPDSQATAAGQQQGQMYAASTPAACPGPAASQHLREPSAPLSQPADAPVDMAGLAMLAPQGSQQLEVGLAVAGPASQGAKAGGQPAQPADSDLTLASQPPGFAAILGSHGEVDQQQMEDEGAAAGAEGAGGAGGGAGGGAATEGGYGSDSRIEEGEEGMGAAEQGPGALPEWVAEGVRSIAERSQGSAERLSSPRQMVGRKVGGARVPCSALHCSVCLH